MAHDEETYRKEFSFSSERSGRIPEAVTRESQVKSEFPGDTVKPFQGEGAREMRGAGEQEAGMSVRNQRMLVWEAQGVRPESRGILNIRQWACDVTRGWNGSEEPDNVSLESSRK